MRAMLLLVLGIFIILIIIPLLVTTGLFFLPSGDEEQLIIKVYDHRQQRIVEMELATYLSGVVAAEMPAAFKMEALKAQAVASRTYTLKQLPQFGGSGSQQYPEADICTNYRYSQAWISEEEMKEKWGFLAFFYFWSRINRAVEETRSEILVYEGQLIDAVYHSNAGGRTEDSAAVWQKQLPYLRSVESPYDREGRSYRREYSFTVEEFDRLLGTDIAFLLSQYRKEEAKQLKSGTENGIFKNITRTISGRIKEMTIGDKIFTGIELRELLNLSSTNINPELREDEVLITVYGNGHGVGMSQEGANGFANHGHKYHQILRHYYRGTEVTTIARYSR